MTSRLLTREDWRKFVPKKGIKPVARFYLLRRITELKMSQNQQERSRRDLLRLAAWAIPAVPLFGTALAGFAQDKKAAETPKSAVPKASPPPAAPTCKMAIETDPLPAAQKFLNDGDKSEGKDKKSPKNTPARCKNCVLYAAPGKKDAGEVAACTLFGGACVKAAGWCRAWAYDPAKES